MQRAESLAWACIAGTLVAVSVQIALSGALTAPTTTVLHSLILTPLDFHHQVAKKWQAQQEAVQKQLAEAAENAAAVEAMMAELVQLRAAAAAAAAVKAQAAERQRLKQERAASAAERKLAAVGDRPQANVSDSDGGGEREESILNAEGTGARLHVEKLRSNRGVENASIGHLHSASGGGAAQKAADEVRSPLRGLGNGHPGFLKRLGTAPHDRKRERGAHSHPHSAPLCRVLDSPKIAPLGSYLAATQPAETMSCKGELEGGKVAFSNEGSDGAAIGMDSEDISGGGSEGGGAEQGGAQETPMVIGSCLTPLGVDDEAGEENDDEGLEASDEGTEQGSEPKRCRTLVHASGHGHMGGQHSKSSTQGGSRHLPINPKPHTLDLHDSTGAVAAAFASRTSQGTATASGHKCSSANKDHTGGLGVAAVRKSASAGTQREATMSLAEAEAWDTRDESRARIAAKRVRHNYRCHLRIPFFWEAPEPEHRHTEV